MFMRQVHWMIDILLIYYFSLVVKENIFCIVILV